MLDDIEEGFGLFVRKEGVRATRQGCRQQGVGRNGKKIGTDYTLKKRNRCLERVFFENVRNARPKSIFLAEVGSSCTFSLDSQRFSGIFPSPFPVPSFWIFDWITLTLLHVLLYSSSLSCVFLCQFLNFIIFFFYPFSRKSTLLKALYRFLEGCYGLSIYLQTLH